MAALLIASGFAREPDNSWIRGVYTGNSPRPILASESEAWQHASELADNLSGAFVLVGTGQSMQPLYTPGTIMVLQQLPFTELKCGQTALYRNKQSKIVAHVLVARTRDGWRARGLNNYIHDMEPVNSGNFVGIVVAAFKPVTSSRSLPLATIH